MFDSLKKNLEQEKKIILDMQSIQVSMQSDAENREFYASSLRALEEQLVLLNNAVPELLKEGSPIVKFAKKSGKVGEVVENPVAKKDVVSMSYVSPVTKEKRFITINKVDKKAFLEKLKLSEGALVGINRIREKGVGGIVIKPSVYARISNKFFRKASDKLAPQFGSLAKDLKTIFFLIKFNF